MTQFPNFSSQGYQVIRELGHNREGGRITYLATQLASGQQVAIKRFCFAQSDSNWSDFKAYEREISILQKLEHPGIPRYLNSFQTPDGFCIVQEYKDAKSLVEQRLFTPEQIKQISISVLEILVYLQNYIPSVYHKDIKPANILVDDRINVYLIDFGFSQIGNEALGESISIAGTLGFMSPEHLHKLNKASDLYSLGVTLICLLTGKTTVTISDLIDRKNSYRIHFKNHVPEHISPNFVCWLQKMVEPNHKKRFQNASSALAALKSIPIVRAENYQIKTNIKIGISFVAGAAIALLALTTGQELYRSFIPDSSTNNQEEEKGKIQNSLPLPTQHSDAKFRVSTTQNYSIDPGNTLGKAFDLGNLKGDRTYQEFVGSVDLDDYYRFQLDKITNFRLSLNGLTKYTYVDLILDRNNNGQVDEDDVLIKNSGSDSISINTPLGAGNYAIRVYPSDRNYNTTYTLQVSAAELETSLPDPGNTPSQGLDLGKLKGDRTYKGFVGSVDFEDYYRFELEQTSNFQVFIDDLNKYSYVELILDRNRNNQIDDGEILNSNFGSDSTLISTPLGAGTYLVRVYPSDRSYNTLYTIRFSANEVGK